MTAFALPLNGHIDDGSRPFPRTFSTGSLRAPLMTGKTRSCVSSLREEERDDAHSRYCQVPNRIADVYCCCGATHQKSPPLIHRLLLLDCAQREIEGESSSISLSKESTSPTTADHEEFSLGDVVGSLHGVHHCFELVLFAKGCDAFGPAQCSGR